MNIYSGVYIPPRYIYYAQTSGGILTLSLPLPPSASR